MRTDSTPAFSPRALAQCPLCALSVLSVFLTLLPLAACSSDPRQGYSFNSSFSSDVRTVHVAMFDNPTFQRGIEVELTDAVIKEIQSNTPWKVTDSSVADTTLSGKITAATMNRLSSNRDSGLSQEIAFAITLDFDFKDARTGKPLVSRRSFTASETFVPTKPVGERLEVGQHATVQQMARDIVSELRSSW